MGRLIGAHQSTAGGYDKAVVSVSEMGGNCLQFFSTSPRSWRPANPSDEIIDLFRGARERYAVDPVYFHASYLINLAGTPDGQEKSKLSLTSELKLASRMGVRGSIIHLGSLKRKDDSALLFEESAYQMLLENARAVLEQTPKDTLFIIENMGMRKVGRTLEEIGYLVGELGDDRVRVCLDTCHLHVAGYDLSTEEKLNLFLQEFDKRIGLERLEVVHVNDSRDSFGSLRDRHENIGDGFVGEGVFRTLLNHTTTKDFPFILETPGLDGGGPDKENIERFKAFLE